MPTYHSASGSVAEDLFIELFSETFGADHAEIFVIRKELCYAVFSGCFDDFRYAISNKFAVFYSTHFISPPVPLAQTP